MFEPVRAFQPTCSFDCSVAYGLKALAKNQEAKRKEAARAHREAKIKAKPRRDYEQDAQRAVNTYVRVRDSHLGCVSCDRPASWQGQWHASHFRSRGAASSIRFHLWNIHKSCSICNNHLSGNLAEYTPRLIEKIGQEKVDWLRAQNAPRKFDIPYLQRLTRVFKLKTKRLLARRKHEMQG